MINNNFTEVKPLCYWVQHILPLVYDDSLSYMELLGRVTKKLNEIIVNNNNLPDFITELIKEYISSGAIEKVLAEVLANYMLNVKFPPAGLKPATGDGSADDTEAIQGCIDYAYNNGGMSVYFPSGSYLTQSLTLRNKATLFGQDRYTTRLILKGGATTPMFTGDVDELTLTGLGFDGNMDIQVNNVNLFTISVNSANITNCLLTDGYDLLNITVNDNLQLNDVIFRHAVENALVLKGAGIVQGNNLIFKSVSALVGKNFVVMDVSKSILEQLKCYGACPNAVLINGSNNVVKMWNEQSLKAYTDNGNNNTVEVYTQSEQKKLTGFKTTNVNGDLTETIGGNKTESITGEKEVNANDLTEVIANEKHVNAGSVTEDITGDKHVNAGSVTEDITGDKHVNAANTVETVQGDKTVTAGDISETAVNKTVHITNDKTEQIDGSDSKHVDGESYLNVGGLRTESFASGATREYTGNTVNTYNADKTDNYNDKHIINGEEALWIYNNLKTTLKEPISIADLPTYAATANIVISELSGDDIVLADIKCNLTIVNCNCKSLTIQRSPNITFNNVTLSGGGDWGIFIVDSTVSLGTVTISGNVTNSCIYADSSYLVITNSVTCNGAVNFGLWVRNSYFTAIGVQFTFSGTYDFLLYLSENSIGLFDTASVSGSYTARGYAVTSGAIANNGGDRYAFNNLFRDTVDNYISQPNVGGIVNNYPDYGITILYNGELSGTEFVSNNIGDAFNKITISIDGCTIAEGDELYIQIEDIAGKLYDTPNWYVGAGTKLTDNTPTAFAQTGAPSTIVCEGGSLQFYVKQLLINSSGYTGTTSISNYGNGKGEFISTTGVILTDQWVRKIHIKTKNNGVLNGYLKIGLEI